MTSTPSLKIPQPHVTVLLEQTLHLLAPLSERRIIDATFGAGGLSRTLLELGALEVLAFDHDPSVYPFAEELTSDFPNSFHFFPFSFSNIARLSKEEGLGCVDAVVYDIGVSSMQLDQAERGFSFMREGPLDMRMKQSGPDAAQMINFSSEAELSQCFSLYGEERLARPIAKAIVNQRIEKPFETTLELAELIESIYRRYRIHSHIHPATRIFQALRIMVNKELEELEAALESCTDFLNPQGRALFISFHSLEDRLIKQSLRRQCLAPSSGSRYLPESHFEMGKNQHPDLKARLLTKSPIVATPEQIKANPRCRSAKLRALEKK